MNPRWLTWCSRKKLHSKLSIILMLTICYWSPIGLQFMCVCLHVFMVLLIDSYNCILFFSFQEEVWSDQDWIWTPSHSRWFWCGLWLCWTNNCWICRCWVNSADVLYRLILRKKQLKWLTYVCLSVLVSVCMCACLFHFVSVFFSMASSLSKTCLWECLSQSLFGKLICLCLSV